MSATVVHPLISAAVALFAAGLPMTVRGYRTPRPRRVKAHRTRAHAGSVSVASILARCAAEARSSGGAPLLVNSWKVSS
ncbi:hypothetical protein [Actinoalloteichus hymeniacidonis]|uniref:hypothetical protein n=1 Tax=Actinoalloteichus hymeniacidonis TaxID=340345 RepID=UPI000853E43B|nr:hypothetical protein [Actinoalloteichus hymeniacidonis]MBB5906641.1 hypothetical protein [Actinoalloteichus hymeniacidonis]